MRRAIASSIAAIAIGSATLASQGCGASEDLSPSDVAQAASATGQAKGSKVAFTGGGSAGGQTFKITGDGVLDNAGRRGDLTFRFSGGGESFEMQEVFLGTSLYMKFPEALRKELGGKRWAKIDLGKVTEGLGIDLDSLGGLGSDPNEQLDMLRSAADAEKVGTEKVRGVETTHVKGTLDLRRYPELVPASNRAAARRSVEKLIKLGGGAKQPFEVWYDDKSLIRRMKEQVKVPGGGDPLEFAMEFYDYGTPVAVKAPPASDTKDVTDLAADEARKQGG